MSVQYYERILSLLPEPALITTSKGKILARNKAAQALHPSGLATEDLFQIVPENTRDDLATYLRHCARNKQPIIGAITFDDTQETATYTSHGAQLEPRSEAIEALILLRLRSREESNLQFHLLRRQIDDLNAEITRRVSAEQALKAQTEWLQVTLKSIGDAVIITDETNCITFMNPVAEAMTGWDLEEATKRPLDDVFIIINEYSRQPVENPAERALRERKVVALANHTILITKFGEQTHIEDTAAPILIDDHVRGAILVFHDVSERKHLERQLIERANYLELANRRKNEFLTMLAHELRTPLNPISNAIQLMKLQKDALSDEKSPMEIIGRQVKHLKRLIDDMLDVSRITLGKMKIQKETLDITKLVGSVCRDFAPQFEQSKVKLNPSLATSSLWVHGDADRITQVLHNLLTNALKFTPAGGTVTVSLDEDDHICIVKVIDDGMGIEERALPDLFEPFTQAEQPLDRGRGGLGLGLSLVKGIVELHGGTVAAESAGVGKGTTLIFSLPSTNASHHQEFEASRSSIPTKHLRILLVEDDEDAATTMCQLLEYLGHEIHHARTGPEGLKKAIAIKPAIIICDIGLPELDGFEVAKRLKKGALTMDIPIVALSGYGERDFIERAKASGFAHHITKPATFAEIQEALLIADQ